VVLAAGAIGSPHLLLLSGVGPASELKGFGIQPLHDLPGVGKNLQDHLDIVVSMRSKNRLPMSMHPLSLWRSLVNLVRYVFRRQGEFTSNIAEAGVFLKSRPDEPIPDLQMHFVPTVPSNHGLDLTNMIKYYGYLIMTCDLRPLSRGEITLASADPLVPPRIHANYLAHERDLERLVTGVKKAREIFAQPAFAPHNKVEFEPGPQVRTDDDIRDWVRNHSETTYHPVGTCKMGNDEMAVVDARLCVHGLQRLRVVDASIMPTLVGGNTNGPATMIGEKGARMILEDAQSRSQPQTLAAAA
jgi:choline dehydrogenase